MKAIEELLLASQVFLLSPALMKQDEVLALDHL
jgi:hypothetical protein